MVTKKYLVGLLAVIVAASYIMITLETGGVRLKVNTASTNFYIFNGSWVLSATENVNLYNGSTKIAKSSTSIGTQNLSDGVVMVWRSTHFANGALISQKYFFNSTSTNVEDFPINETLEVQGGSGLTLRHETTKLTYSGPNYGVTGTGIQFGRMKIEFPDSYSFGRVYSTGRLRLDYALSSYTEQFGFRMYDPAAPTSTVLYLNGSSINRTIELGEPLNITATSNVTGLSVCLSVNHSYLGDNFLCNTTTVTYIWNPTSSTRTFNDSTTSKNLNFSTLANQTVYIRANTYDDINSVRFNLTGVNTSGANYPANVKVYVNNTLAKSIPGTLQEGVATLSTFNDSASSKKFSFTQAGSQQAYLRMNKNSVVYNAKLNITGSEFNSNFNGSQLGYSEFGYVNNSLTTGHSNPANGIDNLTQFGATEKGGWMKNSEYVSGMDNDMRTNISIIYNISSTNTSRMYFHYSYAYNWGDLFNGQLVNLNNINMLFSIYNYTSGTYAVVNNTSIASGAQSTWGCQMVNITLNMNSSFSKNGKSLVMLNLSIGDPDTTLNSANTNNETCDGYDIPGSTGGIFVLTKFNYNFSSNATNPYIDVESDGDMEWNYTGSFNQTVGNSQTANFSDSLNHYLNLCTADSDGNCDIPIAFGTDSSGVLNASTINISLTVYFNPITIDNSYFQNFLDLFTTSSYQNIPIKIEANQGNVTINGINISYNGTGVLNITASYAGNATYAASSSNKNLTIYHSNFVKAFPYSFMTEPIFLPTTVNSTNVSMYGQTSTKPGYNITGKGYSTGFNVSIRLNQSMDSCMNQTVGTSDTVYNFTLNTTKRQILTNITLNQSAGLWLKLNMYNCNASTVYRNWWIELKTCCFSCMACW